MDIQKTIKNVLIQTVALSIILIVLGIVVLGCSGEEEPVKNSLIIYGSYFGGITTLAAAYIASKLFNDWRVQEAYNRIRNFHDEAVDVIIQSAKQLSGLHSTLQNLHTIYNTENITPARDLQLSTELNELTKTTIINLQHLTHDVSVKIAMDYSGSINSNDQKLNFAFDTVLGIVQFVQKIAKDQGVNKANLNYVMEFIRNLNIDLDNYISNTTDFKRSP